MTLRRTCPDTRGTNVAIVPDRIRPAAWQALDLSTIQQRLAQPPAARLHLDNRRESNIPAAELRPGQQADVAPWTGTVLAFPRPAERASRQNGVARKGPEQAASATPGAALASPPLAVKQVPAEDLMPIGRPGAPGAGESMGRLRSVLARRDVRRGALQLILLAVALLGAYYNGRAAGGFQRVIVVPPPEAARHVIT